MLLHVNKFDIKIASERRKERKKKKKKKKKKKTKMGKTGHDDLVY